MQVLSIESQKKLAAQKAISFIENGMTVGLGTGSTAKYAIELISQKVASGLKITTVATSLETEKLAKSLGLEIQNDFTKIDLTIDGADKVDVLGNIIKGGGGALTREKIVAKNSEKFIVIIDESKLADTLKGSYLPVEILPFAFRATIKEITKIIPEVKLRNAGQKLFVTDNGNFIVDCQLQDISNLSSLDTILKQISGVIENGLFLNLAASVIVGKADETTRELIF